MMYADSDDIFNEKHEQITSWKNGSLVVNQITTKRSNPGKNHH